MTSKEKDDIIRSLAIALADMDKYDMKHWEINLAEKLVAAGVLKFLKEKNWYYIEE